MKAQALRSKAGVGDAWTRVQTVVAAARENAVARGRAHLELWESDATRKRLERELLLAEFILRLQVKSAEAAVDAQR